jgi:hypothetical protein
MSVAAKPVCSVWLVSQTCFHTQTIPSLKVCNYERFVTPQVCWHCPLFEISDTQDVSRVHSVPVSILVYWSTYQFSVQKVPSSILTVSTNLEKIICKECVGMSRVSSVGIPMGYRLDARGSIPSRAKYVSLLHSDQTGFGTHPVSYPMGTGGSFPGDKAARA